MRCEPHLCGVIRFVSLLQTLGMGITAPFSVPCSASPVTFQALWSPTPAGFLLPQKRNRAGSHPLSAPGTVKVTDLLQLCISISRNQRECLPGLSDRPWNHVASGSLPGGPPALPGPPPLLSPAHQVAPASCVIPCLLPILTASRGERIKFPKHSGGHFRKKRTYS